MLPFQDLTVEEKVKKKLIFDASKQKKADADKKMQDKLDKMLNNAMWSQAKGTYKEKKKEAVKKISDRKMKTFEDWNKKKREMTQAKKTPSEIQSEEKKMTDQENDDITNILRSYDQDIDSYIESAKKYKPSLGKNLTHDNQYKSILTEAEDDYANRVAMQMKLAQQLAKFKALTQINQFSTDKINQELANIPLKIEEKIDSVKTIIETLLGKLMAPIFQPDLPDFDVNALIGIIKSFLNPVISVTNPLKAVIGNIPILGDLVGILDMLSSGSGQSKLTKEELKKLLPQKPELDPTLTSKLQQLVQDIITFCMTLPTLLIQVIFAMIDVIYSKLNIITSVIPLGGMFPLSLIPAAITATPKILQLIKVLPGMMGDLIKGILMDKLWESMAMAIPKPNIDPGSLAALADEINEQKQAKKSKASKRRDYGDVTKEIYESSLSAAGYTMMQAKNVQTNYKKIYNGTDSTVLKITDFVDNGKEQKLPNAMLNSFDNAGRSILNGTVNTIGGIGDILVYSATLGNANTNMASGNTVEQSSGGEIEPGFTEGQIERKKPSVDDYESYFKGLIAKSDLSAGLKYEKIKKTRAVVGEWYETYKSQLEKYGDEVVFEEEMKPARTGFLNSLIPLQFR